MWLSQGKQRPARGPKLPNQASPKAGALLGPLHRLLCGIAVALPHSMRDCCAWNEREQCHLQMGEAWQCLGRLRRHQGLQRRWQWPFSGRSQLHLVQHSPGCSMLMRVVFRMIDHSIMVLLAARTGVVCWKPDTAMHTVAGELPLYGTNLIELHV